MLRVKVAQSIARGKDALPYDHYVALEWSLKMMAIAHASCRDGTPQVFEHPADLKESRRSITAIVCCMNSDFW